MIMIRNAVTQDSTKPALFGQGLDDALMALVDQELSRKVHTEGGFRNKFQQAPYFSPRAVMRTERWRVYF